MPTARKQISAPRKARGDCLLDRRLSPKQARAFFDLLEHGTTLTAGQTYLRTTHRIKISRAALCQWAKRRRRGHSDDAFHSLIERIRVDNAQASELGQQIGAAHRLNDANVLMLSQALFEARRSEDPQAMKQAAGLFSAVIGAVAKSRQADAEMLRAETSRDKFQYDAAKAALQHAAELREISRSRKGSEQEKVERAVIRLFGTPPVAAMEIPAAAPQTPQIEEAAADVSEATETAEAAR